MPREARSLGDIIRDIAYRKQQAAKARFGRATTPSEASRGVYLSACGEIAAAFGAYGYRFTKSGPHFTRRSGQFDYRISFQSSQNNVAGEYIALWVHANVRSAVLKKWRVTNRSVRGPYDFVAGGQIGILTNGHPWLEWNLADRVKRKQEISSAIDTIRDLAFPYFAQFDDPRNMCLKLQRGQLIGMELLDMFDFVACFSSMSAARDVARNFLLRRSDLMDEYREKQALFEGANPPGRVPSGYAEELAALSVRFGLGDLTVAAQA